MTEKEPESDKIKKARRKLQKQLAESNAQITPETLSKVSRSIIRWIERHASERVNLKEKAITLFDENQHTVSTLSHHVQALRSELQTELTRPLAGRIKAAKESKPESESESGPESEPESE